MNPQELANLAHLRRARDLIDREYARPLDVPTMPACVAKLHTRPRRNHSSSFQEAAAVPPA